MKTDIVKLENRALLKLKSQPRYYRQRLLEELGFIDEQGSAGVMLQVADLVRDLKRTGVYIGPGQGYATCSLLCFCLGITGIDPLEYELPFALFEDRFRAHEPMALTTSPGGLEVAQTILPCFTLTDECLEEKLTLEIVEMTTLLVQKDLSEALSEPMQTIWLDNPTLSMFEQGDTARIFGFLSVGIQEKLREFKPRNHRELALIYALYPTEKLDVILRIKNERATRDWGSVAARRVMRESFGELVYVEQWIQLKQLEKTLPESVRAWIPDNSDGLQLRGQALAATRISIEQAYFKSRAQGRFDDSERQDRVRRIAEAWNNAQAADKARRKEAIKQACARVRERRKHND